MVSFIILLIARTARIACPDRHTHIHRHTHTDTHTQTHTQDNYCNPRCTCAPRVNIYIFRITVVNTPASVSTAAYSCKTRAVRAVMRLFIAIEHPGDLLLTVTVSFSKYYVSGLRKMENVWFSPLLSSP